MQSPESNLLTTRQAAVYLGVSQDLVRRWRAAGRGGPRYHRVNRLIRYRRQDIDAYLAANTGGGSDAQ